jgi:hypothetical protein
MGRVLGRDNGIAQRLNPRPQIGIMNGRDGGLPIIERIIAHGPPLAIGPQGGIGDDGMDVQLRIAVPAQIVGEGGRHHAAGFDGMLLAGFASNCRASIRLASTQPSVALALCSSAVTRR